MNKAHHQVSNRRLRRCRNNCGLIRKGFLARASVDCSFGRLIRGMRGPRSVAWGVMGASIPSSRVQFRPDHFFTIFKNVYLFLKGGRGEAERERWTQNSKQAPGSELSVQSPMWALNSQTARSPPEPKSDAQPTEPPRHS